MTFRIFISSVQDEFAEERRRLKQWLTTDLFVSRFVESVFLFEDVPSRGKPPQEVFLDEVKSSDIYIGFIGSQYYGKASIKRGVSATEQEYDAAGAADCERWVYLKAVDKRDVKAVAFVSRVNRDVTRMIETCRKEGLPDPTWEQNGSSFIVTIWKDMWTTVRLREVGVTNRQMLAMPTLKTKHEMAVAEYMELTGVTRNTATADLAALAKAGIVKRVGAGRGATYVLQKCTINAQNAQSSIDVAEGGALAAKKQQK